MMRRTPLYTMPVTIEELGKDAICVEAEVTFAVYPGDPGNYHCPPSPAESEYRSVHVTEVSGETYDLDRARMHGWEKDLDAYLDVLLYNEWDKYHEEALEYAGDEEEGARDFAMEQEMDRRREERLL